MTDRPAAVVDASVLVDVAIRSEGWSAIGAALRGRPLHAPAHVDVEVMSAVARLARGRAMSALDARDALDRFRAAPITRHALPELVPGAWSRAPSLRVADALYVELAVVLGHPLLTTDARLARACDVAIDASLRPK